MLMNFRGRFKLLFKKLNEKQRQGSEDRQKEQRIYEKIGRFS